MALRVVTVKSAAGDYSSLNAAFVGEVGNLVTLDRQLEIDCYNFIDTTSAATGAGWTTDATHTVLVTAVQNHNGFLGGNGGTSAYSLSGPTVNLVCQISYLTLSGLSVLGFGIGVNTCSNVRLVACISQGVVGSGSAFNIQTTGGTVVVNCLAIGPPGNASYGFFFANATVTCDNCTSIGSDLGFALSGTNAFPLTNCLASGTAGTNFSIFSGSPSWVGSSNCASSDSTIPSSGTGHRTSQTFSLADPAGGDYRLLSTDTGAKGFGTDLSADATYPFAIDFIGTARTAPWDIGCSIAYVVPHHGRFARWAAFGLMGAM